MDVDGVREYLLDSHKRRLPELIERELRVSGDAGKVKSVIGPRRCGKTYLLFQKMKEMLQAGAKRESILYLNFEDPRLFGVLPAEFREIVKLQWRIHKTRREDGMSIFIDEPQNIGGWEAGVRALQDDGFNVYLTGSSSKLLSQEISTSLRGRAIPHTLLPFSFREFLRMKGAEFDYARMDSNEKSRLQGLLDEYMEFGGFPEVVASEEADTKERIISEYFSSIVYKDVVERHRIRNIQVIRWLVKSLTASYAREFSVHKAFLRLKSQGISVGKNTLYSYHSMLEDSFFVFFVHKFSHSVKKRELSMGKSYLCDICFSRLGEAAANRGRKMENTVFLELKRRAGPLTETSYWKNQQKEEVDFIVSERGQPKQLIQVCQDLQDPDVKKREIRALTKASAELGCDNLLIITDNQQTEERINDRRIVYIPLWKWLLEKPHQE